MSKKDKNNQNINSIPKYLLGNYFKKPIKWLAHLINDYGNSKHPFITTGTSYAYAIGDEKRRHPELTELQVRENIDLRIKQNRKKLGLPTENTPSLAAAGLALGSLYYPWLAIPDIIFDTAASIDEPSTSNNLHTIADFPETVAKFTPSKIDDYVAKGVLTLGNIDDAVSTSGRNMFSIFDKKTGKINNTIDKTSVRESTNIRYRKNGGQIRKMQTAAGGPIKRLKDGYRYIPDEKNGGWDRISDNSMADVFATMEFTPKKTKVGSSITRKQSAPSKTYRSAYNPDDIIKGFNALTLGGLNNLSPTQWARRYYDLNKLLISQIPGSKRTMTWSGFVNNWLNGNNGLVSEKFAEEHPYWSMGINGIGDAVALGGLANANKVKLVGDIAAKHGGDATKIAINVAKNSSKPFNWRNYRFLGDSKFYSDLDDAGYKTLMSERLSGNYPLTFTERKNYITGLKKDIQKGVDYAINEAKTNVKAPLKSGKEVEYTFDGGRGWKIEPYSPEDILPLLIHYGTLRATKKYGQTPWEGGYGAFQNKYEGLFFPFRDRPNTLRTHSMFLDAGERISTGAHETRHTVQKYFDTPLVETRDDLPGTYGRYTNRNLPLDFKKKVNEYINDALTAGEWEGSLGEMDAELTGWSAQHGFPRYSQMNPQQKALLHDLFLKRFGGNTDYKNYGEISSLLRLNPDYNTSLLYSKILDDSKIGQIIQGLETLGYRKHGGKMNVLEFLKNGSGIHIKEKNKGKFTSYCGGKVTDECILKGKNSSNPAIRKRATFAANARKWKHKEGGSIEKLEKGSWISKGLNFLNESGLGKTLVEGGLNFLLSSSQNKSIAGATDVAKAELDKEKQEASDYALLMATKKALEMLLMDPNNPNAFGGSIVLNYIRLQLYNEYLNSINLDIANRKALLDMLSLQMLNENTSGAISGIIQSGLGVVGNLLGGKKDTSSTNSTIYNGTSSSTKSIVLPKLTSNKWTPSTSLSNPVLGNNALGFMPNYTSLLNVKK